MTDFTYPTTTGPLREGERVTDETDAKGRRHSVVLRPGAMFHTTKGGISHDDLIGQPEGVVALSVGGAEFLVFRPLLHDVMVAMPRQAAVIYPKDAAHILMQTDIFPGARVLEAGVGSGALSLALLRALGPAGRLYSYERRAEFAEVARKNVRSFYGEEPGTWEVRLGDLAEVIGPEEIDRAILDMLAPWDCIDAVAERLVPGGVLCCYVATATQLGRTADTLRAHGGFTEPVPQGVHRPRLARRGPRHPARARHERPHGLPDVHPSARAGPPGATQEAASGPGRLRPRLRGAAPVLSGRAPPRPLRDPVTISSRKTTADL